MLYHSFKNKITSKQNSYVYPDIELSIKSNFTK